MARWRDIKAKALSIVHRTFEYPAIYLPYIAGVPVPCKVRIHSKVAVNQNEFTWPQASGYAEVDPVVVFDANEVPRPAAKSYVIVSETEIYRVGTPGPVKDGYAACEVVELSGADLAAVVAQIDFLSPPYSDSLV